MSQAQPPPEFPNVVCWDRSSRPRVFDTDALRVLPEVFEATHSPSFLQEQAVAAGTFLRLAEEEYVSDFLTHDDPRTLDLIVGGSGTGKSHLIRWLAHEGRRRNSEFGNRWWIVLVPRSSANLAEVVRSILHGFEGEIVGRLQSELDRAARPMSAEEARRRVLNELELVLRRVAAALPANERELGNDLPDLLRDPAVSRRLLRPEDGILARLAAHFFGQRHTVSEVDPARLLWRQEDLQLTPLEAQRAALDARELANQLMNDEQEREDAASILNRMTASLSGLLGLRRGDLTRALKEIRRDLLAKGRELVLLLEDLSVSQGLDAELLEALIIGDRDGEEPLCRLRATVGLTAEDHGKLRDNILGRVRKTVMCNVPVSDIDTGAEGISREDISAFAARYLNAARYSLMELQEWSQENAQESFPLPGFCAKVHCPNQSTCHAAFGSVTIGTEEYGLYPFTPELLLRFYRQATRQAPGTRSERFLSFNPRRLVGGVLNEVLDQAERTLPDGNFPPRHLTDQFALGAVDIAVRRRLETKYREHQGGRLVNALELYSPDPAAGSPHLAPPISETFSLPVIDQREPGQPEPEVPTSPPPVDVPITVPTPPETKPDPFTAWVSGGRIDDHTLNEWRTLVHNAVWAAIDWDTEPGLGALSGLFMARYIHFDGQFVSSPPNPVELRISRSNEAGLALRTLQGLRLDTLPRNDPASEETLVDLWRWIQDRAEEIRNQLRPIAVNGPASHEVRCFAARLLAIGAFLRGRIRGELTGASLLSQLLEPWGSEDQEPLNRSQAWRSLWHAFSRYTEPARTWLLNALACPKGGETRANILDPSSVLPALEEIVKGNLSYDFPGESETLPAEARLRELGREVRERLPAALKEEKEACAEWIAQVSDSLGGNSPEELATVLEPTFREAALQGRLLGEGALELSGLCLALPHRELDALISQVRSIESLESGPLLSALSSLNRNQMQEYQAFLNLSSRVLDQSLAALGEGGREAMDESVLANEIKTLLDQLEEHVKSLAE